MIRSCFVHRGQEVQSAGDPLAVLSIDEAIRPDKSGQVSCDPVQEEAVRSHYCLTLLISGSCCKFGKTTISMRRFSERPSSVELSSNG